MSKPPVSLFEIDMIVLRSSREVKITKRYRGRGACNATNPALNTRGLVRILAVRPVDQNTGKDAAGCEI